MDHINYFEEQATIIGEYLKIYLMQKQPDCILYSTSGNEFKVRYVHKELFSQTYFMRKILESTKEHCCEIMEIFCPCSEKELGEMVRFLYTGEIKCENRINYLKIMENLNKIFGFPKYLMKGNVLKLLEML